MLTLDGIPPGAKMFDDLAEAGKPVILNFSRGKDSAAVWVELAKRDIEVIAIHKSPVPGLNFVREDLDRYEQYFGQEIIDLPADGFWRMLAFNIFQPPERCAILEACQFTVTTREEWDWTMRDMFADQDTWILDGVRATDSATRRMATERYGPIKEAAKRQSPIWDMHTRDVYATLDSRGIKLGVDYEWWGRSFDGLRYGYIAAIKEHRPEDWETIKFWFPLVDMEIMRGEGRV